MSNELKVETEALRKAAKGFEDASGQVRRIFDRLRSRLDAEGACWGGDETGQQFSQNYITTNKANEFKDSGPDIADGLKKVKANIELMAKRYADAEERSRIR
ncbi:hypothetical protein GCM10009678_89760 [Actinomadura kijaniata]|uniref:WXG100 family type VII secretion target n=1 Tax=Actinomadura namibiensis TaxID=182080 RepID=A0A7W3LWI6_ACTNM|nr:MULTISPECIES: WXG100 family type VII secretion target [Actinomadura]MBA8955551.1 WXG100 family type VII secretion target [Actinomadura namibiensis]